ncbi:MAG: hypothetical protein Q4F65_04875 [Propionibacteriaceae bacterium]|nr:hypothetical protein [Propionibacteriaceae bacterium]
MIRSLAATLSAALIITLAGPAMPITGDSWCSLLPKWPGCRR